MGWPVDTIIFDLDGVLVDSGRDIAAAVNHVLRSLGQDELPSPTVVGFISGGAEPILRQSLGARSDLLFPAALPMFFQHYAEHCIDETILYPGIPRVLRSWTQAGKRMAIATNKTEDVSAYILKHLGVSDCFKVVIGTESVARRKPDPEALHIIMRQLGAVPQQTLMIGDTPADILAGKAAGTMTCGVSYGYGTVEELQAAGPDALVDSPEGLLNLVD